MMLENLHPIVVHFPIALLTIYSLLEIASIHKKVRHSITVWYIKLFLIVVGWVFVQLSLSTGEAAQDAWFWVKNIVERHSLFANISTRIYGVGAAGYLLQWYLYDWITTAWGKKIVSTPVHPFIEKVVTFLRKTQLHIILAILGLVALTATWALGGAMVYGTNADPMVKIMIDILHITP